MLVGCVAVCAMCVCIHVNVAAGERTQCHSSGGAVYLVLRHVTDCRLGWLAREIKDLSVSASQQGAISTSPKPTFFP